MFLTASALWVILAAMIVSMDYSNLVALGSGSVSFGAGFTVVTGDSGTGKSVLLQAIRSVGGRVALPMDNMASAEGAHVALDFSQSATGGGRFKVRASCTKLQRSQLPSGRSRYTLNQTQVTRSEVQRAADHLVFGYDQYAQQSLLRGNAAMELLDTFAQLDGERERVAEQWLHLDHLKRELARSQSLQQSSRVEREHWAWVDEVLSKTLPLENEVEMLRLEREQIKSRCDVIEASLDLVSYFETSELTDLLGRTAKAIERAIASNAKREDADAAECVARMDAASAELGALHQSLLALHCGRQDDTARLSEIEGRLSVLLEVGRSLRHPAEELAALATKAKERLDEIAACTDGLVELEKTCAAEGAKFEALCARLSERRRVAARAFADKVQAEFAELGLGHKAIDLIISRRSAPDRSGMDDVSFAMSTGSERASPQAINSASGGELARIFLAIITIMRVQSPAGTLLLDEPDIGVGGRVAAAIGDRLRAMAQAGTQVIVISHSPQIAARADVHIAVHRRRNQASGLQSRLIQLGYGQRVEELAKLLSGRQVTDEARAAATALLEETAISDRMSPAAGRARTKATELAA